MLRNFLLLFLFLSMSCTKKEVVYQNPISFDIEPVDTLKSNEINRKEIQYSNLDYQNNGQRYIEVLYVISDSKFNGNMDSLDNYTHGGLKYVKEVDTLEIQTFKERGNKIITFVVYDEIQLPSQSNSKDSVRIQSVTSTFFQKTYIK